MRTTPADAEEAAIAHRSSYAVVGSAATAQQRLEELLEETAADEFIAVAQIYDHQARLRSYELGAEIFRSLPSLTSRFPDRACRVFELPELVGLDGTGIFDS